MIATAVMITRIQENSQKIFSKSSKTTNKVINPIRKIEENMLGIIFPSPSIMETTKVLYMFSIASMSTSNSVDHSMEH